MSKISDFLFGQKAKTSKLPTLNPQQQSILSQLLGSINPQQLNLENNPLYQSGQSYLQNILSGSPESTEAFEAPYLRQFNERTIPGLAEQFAGVGAQSSSAFQQALGQAGAGLQEQLASLRGGLQNQAAGQALGYAQAPGQQGLQAANLGLGVSPFAYSQRGAGTGALGGLLGGAGFGAGSGLGALLARLFGG